MPPTRLEFFGVGGTAVPELYRRWVRHPFRVQNWQRRTRHAPYLHIYARHLTTPDDAI